MLQVAPGYGYMSRLPPPAGAMDRELSLRDLNRAGRRAYLALHLAEHVLGEERFTPVLGGAKAHCRARMEEYFTGWPTDVHRPVREVTFTSHADFYRQVPDWEPAVFRGVAKSWPAVGKWDLDFFGRNYADTTAVLIDQHGLYGEGEEARYVVWNLGRLIASIKAGKRECLRFVPLVDDNPELKNDLDMAWFNGFRSPFALREFTQFFLAPASTFTPVHCAHESNAFLQVYGQKRWLLWPARYQPLMQPAADGRPYFHTSFLPAPRSQERTLGSYAPAWEVVLDPGDVLYIPPFVWHYVENLTDTIALAYRFFSIRAGLRSSRAMTLIKFMATRPSIFHSLVCPRRSLTRRCRTDGCPFAIPQTAAEPA